MGGRFCAKTGVSYKTGSAFLGGSAERVFPFTRQVWLTRGRHPAHPVAAYDSRHRPGPADIGVRKLVAGRRPEAGRAEQGARAQKAPTEPAQLFPPGRSDSAGTGAGRRSPRAQVGAACRAGHRGHQERPPGEDAGTEPPCPAFRPTVRHQGFPERRYSTSLRTRTRLNLTHTASVQGRPLATHLGEPRRRTASVTLAAVH